MAGTSRRRQALERRKAALRARAEEAADEVYGWKLGADPRGRLRLTWTLDRDPLVALAALENVRSGVLGGLEAELVTMCRREGLDWSSIGWALDMSRQAAQKRHPDVDDVLARESTRQAS